RPRGRLGERPSGRAAARRRFEPRALRVSLDRSVQPLARPGHRAPIPRRDLAQGGAQSRALLLHVRAEILLDEDHPGRARLRRDPERSAGGYGGDVGKIPADGKRGLRRGGQGEGEQSGAVMVWVPPPRSDSRYPNILWFWLQRCGLLE